MTHSRADNRVAILAADGIFSYADLDEVSARVAAALVGLVPGATGGDLGERRVAFLVPPSFGYVVIQRAIWRAGGIAVPLAVSHPPAELEYVVADAGASIVIGSGRLAGDLAAIAASAGVPFVPTPDLLAADPASWTDAPTTAGRRAMILYTSGTTGKPKGVVTTHGNIAAQIASLVDAWEWTARDTALLALPLHHVHGLINVLGCALAAQAACQILPQFDTEAVWERLASGEITVFSSVPTIYARLIQSWEAASPLVQRQRTAGCANVRLMMSGSAALPVSTLERWREISGHVLLERYGMTEIGMALSNNLHGTRRPGSVGAPLPDIRVRIVDEQGQTVPDGTSGELDVRGPGVFHEYWRRPDETRDAFRDGWFRTGDMAVVDDGVYRLLGRTSIDIIKTGGYKVSALEIEEAIRDHPAVRDCAVVGIPDDEWGERVMAAAELMRDADLDLLSLREWLRPRLAPYKIPTGLHCVEALPRNAMGKVVKPSLQLLLANLKD